MATEIKPGRPRKGEHVMTPAQRMRGTRKRRQEAIWAASDDPRSATDIAITNAIADRLLKPHPEAETQRYVIAKLTTELFNRYCAD